MVDPTDQIAGNSAKPCAMFVGSVISAMTLFATPTFPFNAPSMQRLTIRAQYWRDNAKPSIDNVKPNNPIMRTGRLPIRSERRPHCKMHKASVK